MAIDTDNFSRIPTRGELSALRMTEDDYYSFIDRVGDSLLPLKAVAMSRVGRARGYDESRFEHRPQFSALSVPRAVVEVTRHRVKWLATASEEKTFLIKDRREREKYVKIQRANRITPWELLHPDNFEFLHALLWIPVDMMEPLELVAMACEADECDLKYPTKF